MLKNYKINQISPNYIYNFLFIFAGFLLALLPRFIAAQGDLWLDEIWSVFLVKSATQLLDILYIRHDNNHILNSLYLYLIGDNRSAFIYRLVSILSGSATVVIMGLINLKRGLVAGIITLCLGTFSYPLIHYSSEARGYALGMFFALTSYVFFNKALSKTSMWPVILFQVSVLFGMLSHLMFIFVYVSLLAWFMTNQLRLGGRLNQLGVRLIIWNLAPITVSLALYFFFFQKMLIGGGDPRNHSDVLVSVGSLISGAIKFPPLEATGILLSCIGFAVTFQHLRQEAGGEEIFYLGVVILVPLIFWLVVRPGFLSERYFFLGLPFFYVMIGRLLANLWQAHVFQKSICLLVLLFFSAGNFQRSIDLMTIGRGGYRQAVQFMASQTLENNISVGSDHDFRNKILLQYFSQYLPQEKKLLYFEKGHWPFDGPEWLIAHSQKDDFTPPNIIEFKGIGNYFLSEIFQYKGLSGFHWALYRQHNQTTE